MAHSEAERERSILSEEEPGVSPAEDRAAAHRGATVRRHILIIFNPASGRRNRHLFTETVRALSLMGAEVTIQETSGAGDAEQMARAADPDRYDVVVAAGGDGTINEVVNGLRDPGPPLGLIPLGTANVLALELGLRPRAENLARAIIRGTASDAFVAKAIFTGLRQTRRFAPGHGRRFMLMAGVGFDANVVAKVSPRLKDYIGKGAYAVRALAEFIRYKPAVYAVTVDGVRHEAASVVVANGRYYAGRFVCAPEADLGRASVEVCLFTRTGRWSVLRYALALALGRLHRLDDVKILRAEAVEIDGPTGEPVQIDGDLAGALPVRIDAAVSQMALLEPEPGDRRRRG